MKYLILVILLTGCIPEVPEVPEGAICTSDGFVLRPVINDPLDFTTWQFILDETGQSMTCVFQ